MLSVQVIHDIPNSTISTTFSQFVALFIYSVSQRSVVSRLIKNLLIIKIICDIDKKKLNDKISTNTS